MEFFKSPDQMIHCHLNDDHLHMIMICYIKKIIDVSMKLECKTTHN